MNLAVALLASAGAAVLAVALWLRLPPDPVAGRLARIEPRGGLHGQAALWLGNQAYLAGPQLEGAGTQWPAVESTWPAQRGLEAILHRMQAEHGIGAEEAVRRLQARKLSPAARAFLRGSMPETVRHHARSRYAGPPALFWPWYGLVHLVRHGPRRLRASALQSVLAELRNR